MEFGAARPPYLAHVVLQSVLGLGGLCDAVGEGHVDPVELAPHADGVALHHPLGLVHDLPGVHPLVLGPHDVVLRELGPRLGH